MYSLTSVVSLTGLVCLIRFVTGLPEPVLIQRQGQGDPVGACNTLNQQYAGQVWLPGTENYNWENSRYFDARSWLGPACVFTPNTAQDVSSFVQLIKTLNVPFAIRSGGHMPIPGYANINSTGILLSTSNLVSKSLSDDKQTVSAGSGNLWQDLYTFLEPEGLVACGGRDGPTGLSGLLLGGGYSFLSSKLGFCAGTIRAYEVVLASGDIVTANSSNEYSDLYWALKGGGNSFGLVTRFDLIPQPSSNGYAGVQFFGQGPEVQKKYFDGLYYFTKYGSEDDHRASFEAEIYWFPGLSPDPFFSSWQFYNADPGEPVSNAFENFTAPVLPPTWSNWGPQSMSEFANSVGFPTSSIKGARERFYTRSFVNTPAAYNTYYNTYIETAQQLLTNVKDCGVTLALGPVTNNFIRQTMGPNGDATPLGLNLATGPFLIADQVLTWILPTDDDIMANFVEIVNQKLDVVLANFSVPYRYMNDADGGQGIFEGYGKSNVQTLQSIRDKYDPDLVYTNLLPGGFKVANVDINSIPDSNASVSA